MFKTVLFIIGLLSAHLRFATAGDFLLGMDYSKTIATGGFSSGFTDAAGSFYFVTNTATSSTISKFAVNGSVVWSHIVRFWVMQVAASPAGDIYAAGYTSNGTVNTGLVDRLDPATLTDHVFTVGLVPSLLAVDSAGRTYLAGTSAGPLDVTEHALLKTRPEGEYSFLIRQRAESQHEIGARGNAREVKRALIIRDRDRAANSGRSAGVSVTQ